MKSINRVYFVLVSFIAILGAAIGYGIAGTSVIMQSYISDDEYIAKNGYEVDNCKFNPTPWKAPSVEGEDVVKPTVEEITQCEEEAKAKLLLRRSITTKEAVVGGLIWGSIGLLLFLIHFPIMQKNARLDRRLAE